MSPLDLNIMYGSADASLLKHISMLESFERRSEGEDQTLQLCYARLDQLTEPKPKDGT